MDTKDTKGSELVSSLCPSYPLCLFSAATANRKPLLPLRWNHARPAGLALGQPLLLVAARFVGLDGRRAIHDAAVQQLLLVRDRLEEEPIAGDLRHHEVMLGHRDLVEVALVHVVEIPPAAA